jgi:hypothetical protein
MRSKSPLPGFQRQKASVGVSIARRGVDHEDFGSGSNVRVVTGSRRRVLYRRERADWDDLPQCADHPSRTGRRHRQPGENPSSKLTGNRAVSL